MLSTEEISYAAMRSGFDDVMAFLNVTVALNSLIFCWILVVLAIKGSAVLRVRHSKRLTATLEFEVGADGHESGLGKGGASRDIARV